jgi:uncharacterized protein (AIM24 family)
MSNNSAIFPVLCGMIVIVGCASDPAGTPVESNPGNDAGSSVLPPPDAGGAAADTGVLENNSYWSLRFGASQMERVSAVTSDAAGNIVVAGEIESDTDLGGGPLKASGGFDILLAKFSPQGKHLWSKRFGDSAFFQEAKAVAVDSTGNIYIAGQLDGTADFGGGVLVAAGKDDVFVAKFDSNGGYLWAKRYGDIDSGQYAHAMTVDAAGDVVVAGEFSGTVDFGDGALVATGGHDAFLTKLHANGDHVWSKRYGGAAITTAEAVRTDAAGNIVLTGSFGATVDFSAGTGTPVVADGAGKDIFLVKLDALGKHQWSKRFGDRATAQSGDALDLDPSGNILLGCTFEGTVNFGGMPLTAPATAGTTSNVAVALFNGSGTHVWSKTFGDAARQNLEGVAFDKNGDAFIAGPFRGEVVFGSNTLSAGTTTSLFIAKLDKSTGNPLWSKGYGKDSDFNVSALTVDRAGGVVYAGGFTGTVDFGDGPRSTPTGNYDGIIARLAGK